MFFFDIKSLYSSSAFSNIAITFLFTLFSSLHSSEKFSIKNKRKKDKKKKSALWSANDKRECDRESEGSRSQADKKMFLTQKITILVVILQ